MAMQTRERGGGEDEGALCAANFTLQDDVALIGASLADAPLHCTGGDEPEACCVRCAARSNECFAW